MWDVIYINYNSTDFLIESIASLTPGLEAGTFGVVVFDNNSSDGVVRVRRAFPQVKLLRSRKNVGFSRAVNSCLRVTHAPLVVLLNPDTVVSAGFFDCIGSYFANHPEVAIVGPKILDPDGRLQGSARAFPTPMTGIFSRSSLMSRLFPLNRFTRRDVLTTENEGRFACPVDWVSGACMVIRREAIDQVGLLDERFFLYWEDADWCRRMWQAGWKVHYCPETEVMHYVAGSSRTRPMRALLELHLSAYRFYQKHTNGLHQLMVPIAFWGLFLRLAAAIFSQSYMRLFDKQYSTDGTLSVCRIKRPQNTWPKDESQYIKDRIS